MRVFETGATRSDDSGRLLYTGYLSPLVIQRFGEYMTRHRLQEDGSLRAPDNWRKGMPKQSYLDGMFRHFEHLWLRHDGHPVNDPKAEPGIQDDLCALWFNVQGYLHTLLVEEEAPKNEGEAGLRS